jgi:hypothetical protein
MTLYWEEVKSDPSQYWNVHRAKVPGGWLVLAAYGTNSGLTFYPDPDHDWDGSSLP